MADLVYTRLKAWCETKSQKTEFKKSIGMKKAAFKNSVCKKSTYEQTASKNSGCYCILPTDGICSGLVEHAKLSVRMTDRNFWFSETQDYFQYFLTLKILKGNVHLYLVI